MQDLSLFLLDLVQNSLRAGCTWVKISLAFCGETLTLSVQDNGCGMEKAQCEKAFSPFYTTKTKRGGFGLPLFRMACEQTGGTASLSSCAGEGTTVAGVLCINHIDCPPLGKLGDTMAALIAGNESIRFCLTASGKDRRFSLDTDQIVKSLQGVPLSTPEIVIFLAKYIEEQTQIIRGGVEENEKSC